MSLFSFLREPGAGVLFDYAVYHITALVSLLGPVSRVGGLSRNPHKIYENVVLDSHEYGEKIINVNESRVSAVVMLQNGISGTAHFDNNSIMADQSYFAVYGTKGILYLTDPNTFGGNVRLLTNPISPLEKAETSTLWNFLKYSENERGIGPSDLVEAFETRRKPRASKEMAYHVLEVLDSMRKGGEIGEFIDIKSTFEKPAPMQFSEVPITNIGHTSFCAKNMQKMLDFYCDVLDMQRKFTLTTQHLESLNEKVEGRTSSKEKDYVKPVIKPWIEYLILADRQYIEFFHDLGETRKSFSNRDNYYGYQKVNFEVDDIDVIKKILVSSDVEIVQDIHKVVDGALEIVVHDPDGNEVQFTQYTNEGLIPLTEKTEHNVYSNVKFTTQVAYSVRDAVNMRNFYTRGLGLKLVKTLKYSDLIAHLEKVNSSHKTVELLKIPNDERWIDFIEVAPHQYIELFYNNEASKLEERDLSGYYNYQHLCLEVSGIFKAKEAIINNGLVLDTDISFGPDGALQLWIVDPDGNRIELMQYTDKSLHLR